MSATERWVLLRNLKAASVYQFRVSAVNAVGEGPPSDPSNVIRLPQEGKKNSNRNQFLKFIIINIENLTFNSNYAFIIHSTIWSARWICWLSTFVVRNNYTMATAIRRASVSN